MSRTSKTSYVMMSLIVAITSALIGCSAQTNQATTSSQQSAAEQPAATAQEVQKREHLTIQAPVGISLSSPIYKMIEDKSLSPFVENVEYKPWKTPDELRARISSGQAEVSAVPTYVGANLYNRGMDVKLINTLIWGILYMIGPDGEAVSWDSLRGQTVHVPFKGDMPDLVFRYLLKKNNLDPTKDVKIEYVSAPQELVGLLVAGKAKYAILPEHMATMSVMQGNKAGKKLGKVMSLQAEWAKATGKSPRIPQAGILVSGELIAKHPELVAELQKQFEQSVQFLNEKPKDAAAMIAKYQDGLTPPIIESVIPSLNLQFVSAKDAKEELEFFFTELSTLSPEIIGGKLPDAGFYYAP